MFLDVWIPSKHNQYLGNEIWLRIGEFLRYDIWQKQCWLSCLFGEFSEPNFVELIEAFYLLLGIDIEQRK